MLTTRCRFGARVRSSQPTRRSRTAMRHAGLENCKMGPSASENAYEQAKKRSGKKRRAAPIAFPDVLGHVDDVQYHTVTSMPHTAAVARSSYISAPPTSATHSGTQSAPSRRSSSRSCPGGARAGAAASARHHQPPRPDRRTPPGCIDRGVLAGACASIPGPVGAAPVRGRSRASAVLRANRERLWPQRGGLGRRMGRLVGGTEPWGTVRIAQLSRHRRCAFPTSGQTPTVLSVSPARWRRRSKRPRPLVAPNATLKARSDNLVVVTTAISEASPFPRHATKTLRECPGEEAGGTDRSAQAPLIRPGWLPEKRPVGACPRAKRTEGTVREQKSL